MFRALFLSLMLVLVLLVACAGPTPKPDAAAPGAGQQLTLHFDWPEGVTVAVRTEEEKERQGQVVERSVETETQSWERVGSELRIRTAEVKAEGNDEMARLLEQVSPPTVAVDLQTAKLLRLDGLEATIAALRAALAEADEAPADPEKMTALLTESLESAYQSDWESLVAFWANKTVTLGQAVKGDTVGPAGIPGTDEVKQDYEFRAERAIPCTGRTVEQRCVLLTYRSTPDKALLPEIANQMMKATAEAAGQSTRDLPPITRFELSNTVDLVTEPQTLLPHRREKRRTLIIGFEVPGHGKVEMTQVDTESTSYTYSPAR